MKTKGDSSIKTLFMGSAYITVVQGLMVLITLGITVILTKVLSLSSIGIYFIILQTAIILSLFCKLGTQLSSQKIIIEVIVRNPGQVTKLVYKFWFIILVTSSLLLLLITLIFLVNLYFLGYNCLTSENLFFLFLMVVVLTFEHVNSSLLRAMDRLFFSAVINRFISQFIFLCLLLSVLSVNVSASLKITLSLWLISGLSTVLFSFILIIFALKQFKKNIDHNNETISIKQILRLSVPMCFSSATAIIRNRSDEIIIGAVIGASYAGIYGPIRRVSRLIGFIVTSINQMIMPIISKSNAQNNNNEIETVCRTAASFSIVIGLIITIITLVFGEFVLSLLFGKDFAGHYLLLYILILGPVFQTIFIDPGNILNMLDEHLFVMRTSILVTTVSILLMIACAEWFSYYGVAVSASLGTIMIISILSFYLYKTKGIRNYPYPFSQVYLKKNNDKLKNR